MPLPWGMKQNNPTRLARHLGRVHVMPLAGVRQRNESVPCKKSKTFSGNREPLRLQGLKEERIMSREKPNDTTKFLTEIAIAGAPINLKVQPHAVSIS